MKCQGKVDRTVSVQGEVDEYIRDL